MSKQLVTMTNVEVNIPVQKRDGGVYQAVRLTYTDGSGRTVTKAIATAILSREENTGLAIKLNNLAQQSLPKEVVLATVQNGPFANITDIQDPSEVDPASLSSNSQTSEHPQQNTLRSSNPFTSKRSGGGRDERTDKRIQAQVALKAAVEFAVGTGVTDASKVAELARTFNTILSSMVE